MEIGDIPIPVRRDDGRPVGCRAGSGQLPERRDGRSQGENGSESGRGVHLELRAGRNLANTFRSLVAVEMFILEPQTLPLRSVILYLVESFLQCVFDSGKHRDRLRPHSLR